eukprot:5781369-Pyramimonas_sp.AAC.1
MPQAAPCATQGRPQRSRPQVYYEMRMFVFANTSIVLPVYMGPIWLEHPPSYHPPTRSYDNE